MTTTTTTTTTPVRVAPAHASPPSSINHRLLPCQPTPSHVSSITLPVVARRLNSQYTTCLCDACLDNHSPRDNSAPPHRRTIVHDSAPLYRRTTVLQMHSMTRLSVCQASEPPCNVSPASCTITSASDQRTKQQTNRECERLTAWQSYALSDCLSCKQTTVQLRHTDLSPRSQLASELHSHVI